MVASCNCHSLVAGGQLASSSSSSVVASSLVVAAAPPPQQQTDVLFCPIAGRDHHATNYEELEHSAQHIHSNFHVSPCVELDSWPIGGKLAVY